MKEKLQEYALLAEVISAIAIVISLIFVGIQINQNTEQSRLDAIIGIKKETLIGGRAAIQSEESVSAIRKLLNDEPLSSKEELYISFLANDIFGVADIAFEQFQNGRLGEDDLIPSMSQLSFFMNFERVRAHWERVKTTNFQPDFIEYVEEYVNKE